MQDQQYQVFTKVDRYDACGWDKTVVFIGGEDEAYKVSEALDKLLVAMGFTEYAIQYENPNFLCDDGTPRGVEINIRRLRDD